MNFKNKYLVITLRTILGLLFIFSGISGFVMGPTPEGIPQEMIVNNQALWDMGIFHMIKTTETIAGLMLLFGFLPALAILFLAPIGIGIVVVNALLVPSVLPLGIIVCLFLAYFGYVYWDKYRVLFKE